MLNSGCLVVGLLFAAGAPASGAPGGVPLQGTFGIALPSIGDAFGALFPVGTAPEAATDADEVSCGGFSPIQSKCQTVLNARCCGLSLWIVVESPFTGSLAAHAVTETGHAHMECIHLAGDEVHCHGMLDGWFEPGQSVEVSGGASPVAVGEWRIHARSP